MKGGYGFLFVRSKRHFCTELISWEHVACPLSGIKRRPLVGGWPLVSIRAIASVRYREVVRSWEGPLWEAPLYIEKMYILQNLHRNKGYLVHVGK